MSDFECRSCGSSDVFEFLDLGMHALADGLVTEAGLAATDDEYPLDVVLCNTCELVQITETVDPEILFSSDYPYFSSFSPALLEHSRLNVEAMMQRHTLSPDSLVVEVASNDGYLLKNYVAAGIPVLGIDPADGPVKAALDAGVETMHAFFSTGVAEKLVADGVRADIIHGNNVLAHVADTNGFVAGMATLLKDDGVIVIEAPYVRDLIAHLEFDTIYHQHLCYFSATSFKNLFARHGLYLNDIEWLPIHGGSLRFFAGKADDPTSELTALLAEEKELGLGTPEYYANFGERVSQLKVELNELLRGLKADGNRIAAYGAAAKGTTLVNYCGIGGDILDYVVDRNTHKHDKYLPGQRIPIRATELLVQDQPDYVLVLAWNFLDEIMAQQSEYLAAGGKFIRPVPTAEIVEAP